MPNIPDAPTTPALSQAAIEASHANPAVSSLTATEAPPTAAQPASEPTQQAPDTLAADAAHDAATKAPDLASLASVVTPGDTDTHDAAGADGAAPAVTTEPTHTSEPVQAADMADVSAADTPQTAIEPDVLADAQDGGQDQPDNSKPKSRLFVTGIGNAVSRVKSGIRENPLATAWRQAAEMNAEAKARAAITPEDRMVAVLDQGVENVRPEQRAALLALAKDRVQAEFLGADGTKQPLDVAAMGLNADQARQLGVLLEEVQLAALKDARDSRNTEKNENFDNDNSRNVVVKKESDGSVSLVVVTSVDGNKVQIDAQGRVKPVDTDQKDLTFDFIGYNLTEKGKLTTNASGVSTVDLPREGRPSSQNEAIAETVMSASKDPLTYTDQLRALGLPTVDYSVSERDALLAKASENGNDTQVIPEDSIGFDASSKIENSSAYRTDKQYRVVDVQRKSDLTGKGAEDAAAKRMRQGLRQVLDLEDKGAFENGKVPTIYVGKEEFRHVAQEIAVEGVKIPDKEAQQAVESTERKTVEVSQANYNKINGLTTSEREGLIASMGLNTDPSLVDFQVPRGETHLDGALTLGSSEDVLDQAAGRQALLQTDINRGEPYLSAALAATADNAAVIYSLNPNSEGGIKGADDRLQKVRDTIDKAIAENKTGGLTRNEYARQQLESTFGTDVGGNAEKQARLDSLADRLYPLTDREHIARARTITREAGQSVEDWRNNVRQELAKADIEDEDRNALLSEITSPKIDYPRLLSIRTQAELDAYDNELRSVGGLPEDIKNAVKLDPVLTDSMVSSLASTTDPAERYKARKRLEDQFGATLTPDQRTILDAIAPEPRPERTLEERLAAGEGTRKDLNNISSLADSFGYVLVPKSPQKPGE
ncbi:MAG TPA: hypothetical protein VF189_00105 [Patescibacteria group bacterium]